MKRFKALLLTLALVTGLAAGLALAPSAEAGSNCFISACSRCCLLATGEWVCTDVCVYPD